MSSMGLPVDQPASPGQSMTRLHCSQRLQEGCWGREGPGVTTPASEMPVNAAADETKRRPRALLSGTLSKRKQSQHLCLHLQGVQHQDKVLSSF